ncbi:MAG: Mrp/NBP35 family ATP-binding protein [Acholeplasmataceae bacterium]|nr:Mrp/NBP35 family ATP-binding protein [Acholeplasmataceae bacterium]
MVDYQELRAKIESLVDPGYKKQIGKVDGLKKLTVGPTGIVDVVIALKYPNSKDEIDFKIELTKLVKLELGFPGIKITFEKNEFLEKDEKKITYIGIASGKGGVGKSTFTANLAYSLTRLGKKVGIIDADVYGATIADIYGIPFEKPTATANELMIPPSASGIEIISTAFFVEDNKPVMWRGPMIGKLLEHYFNGVKWADNTDYVLIDLPPGTGDAALDINRFAPDAKMIIITTPHINASNVALKAGLGAVQIGHELIGVVENMSYYHNTCNNKKEFIFGEGGGELVSHRLSVPLLGQIPINQPDEGFIYEADEEVGKIYDEIAEMIIHLI